MLVYAGGAVSIRPWPSVRTDIIKRLLEDQGCVATTMVDYNALPQHGPGGWPGRALSTGLRTIEEKALCVQDAVRTDLVTEMGARFDCDRFAPFVVMHEFEDLLFSDCAAFSLGISRPDLEPFVRSGSSLKRRKRSTIYGTARLPNGSKLSCTATRSLFLECWPCSRSDSLAFGQSARISIAG